jgi:hypothetical protein
LLALRRTVEPIVDSIAWPPPPSEGAPMRQDPTLSELLTRLRELEAALPRARQELLDADDGYDRRGAALERKVREHVERYTDPTARRGRAIRDMAQEVMDRLARFHATRADLMSRVALLGLQLDGAIISLTIGEIRALLTFDRESDGAVRLGSLVDLDKTRLRQALVLSNAVAAGNGALDAIRLATNMILLRQGELERYVGETFTVSLDKVRKALGDLATEKAKDAAFESALETVLKEVAKALGVAAQSTFPILKVIVVGRDVYKKLREVADPYTPRGDADDVADFADRLRLADDVIAFNLTQIDEIANSLTHPIAAGSGL